MTYSELQRRTDAIARNRENRGRMASTSTTYDTTGTGVVEFDERIDFGITFIERPRVHYGSECDADGLREVCDVLDSVTLPLPSCSGSVTAWDQDDNDNYVGAWVATKVTSEDFPLADIAVTHHFDFIAVGLKVIPMDQE